MPHSRGREEQIVERLRGLMQQPEEEVSLAAAALLIASMEYPALESDPYIRRLDEIAARVSARATGQTDPYQIIAEINRWLFLADLDATPGGKRVSLALVVEEAAAAKVTGIPIML